MIWTFQDATNSLNWRYFMNNFHLSLSLVFMLCSPIYRKPKNSFHVTQNWWDVKNAIWSSDEYSFESLPDIDTRVEGIICDGISSSSSQYTLKSQKKLIELSHLEYTYFLHQYRSKLFSISYRYLLLLREGKIMIKLTSFYDSECCYKPYCSLCALRYSIKILISKFSCVVNLHFFIFLSPYC